MTVRKFLKDPLFHFLAAGLALFVAGSALKPAEPPTDAIVVDRNALLSFIQYRSKAFEAATAAAILDGLDDRAREELVRDYVREEALTREAAALGLDANDYVIRQRMVQKIEFLAEAAAEFADPVDADLAAYYDANRDRYASPPSATLTHVFFSTEKETPDAAKARADRALARLKAAKAGFNDATADGDRFLFHKNYVDRTNDYIGSQLGGEVERAAFDPEGALNEWRGPLRSDYGWHLIYVTARAPARLPPLAEIADLVRSDLAEERRQSAIDNSIDAIVAKYRVDDRLAAGG